LKFRAENNFTLQIILFENSVREEAMPVNVIKCCVFKKNYRPFFPPEKPAASVKAEPTVAADSKSKGEASSPVGDVGCSVCKKIFTRQSVLNVHLQGPMLQNFLRP
jgi:Zinc-finger of C2H2 type